MAEETKPTEKPIENFTFTEMLPVLKKEERARIKPSKINRRHIAIITLQLDGLMDTQIAKKLDCSVDYIYQLNCNPIFKAKREEMLQQIQERKVAMLAGQYTKQGDAILEQAYPDAAKKLVDLMKDEKVHPRVQQISAVEIKETVKSKHEKSPSITIEIPDGVGAALNILLGRLNPEKKEIDAKDNNKTGVVDITPTDVG